MIEGLCIRTYLHYCETLTFSSIPTFFCNFWLNQEVSYVYQNARIYTVRFQVAFKRQTLSFGESNRTPTVGVHIGLLRL